MKKENKFKKGLKVVITGAIGLGAVGGGVVVNQIDKANNPHDYVPENAEKLTVDDMTEEKLKLVGLDKEQIEKYNEYKKELDSEELTEEELEKMPLKIYKLGIDVFKSKVIDSTGIPSERIRIDVSHNYEGAKERTIRLLLKDEKGEEKSYTYREDNWPSGIFSDPELSDKVASYFGDMAKIDRLQNLLEPRNEGINDKVKPDEIKQTLKEALESIENIMPDQIIVKENSIETKTMPKDLPLYETDFTRIDEEVEGKHFKANIKQVIEDKEIEDEGQEK